MKNVIELNEQIAKTIKETKKHISFLADSTPEIKTNLQSILLTLDAIVISLGTVRDLCETEQKNKEEKFSDFETDRALKNQAYDFIISEMTQNHFKIFCKCYPLSTYYKKRVLL